MQDPKQNTQDCTAPLYVICNNVGDVKCHKYNIQSFWYLNRSQFNAVGFVFLLCVWFFFMSDSMVTVVIYFFLVNFNS
jgi:hypothetical protein